MNNEKEKQVLIPYEIFKETYCLLSVIRYDMKSIPEDLIGPIHAWFEQKHSSIARHEKYSKYLRAKQTGDKGASDAALIEYFKEKIFT